MSTFVYISVEKVHVTTSFPEGKLCCAVWGDTGRKAFCSEAGKIYLNFLLHCCCCWENSIVQYDWNSPKASLVPGKSSKWEGEKCKYYKTFSKALLILSSLCWWPYCNHCRLVNQILRSTSWVENRKAWGINGQHHASGKRTESKILPV